MKLTVIGCGDAFGSGGRLNACFHVATAQQRFLLDCGVSSLIGMRQAGVDPGAVDAVIISHLHGDHFGGLPFLLLDAFYVQKRTRPLTLIGPRGLRARLAMLAEALYPGLDLAAGDFPIEYLTLDREKPLPLGNLEIRAGRANHSEAADPHLLRLTVGEKVLAFSGDTAWTEALVPIAQNADLFITECSAWDCPSEVHLDYATLRSHIERLRPARTLLTHMNPDMLANVDRIDKRYFIAAHDGMTLDI